MLVLAKRLSILYCNVSRHQINTCTVLYFSVLYCIKKRKFADKQTNRQAKNVSKTEVHSTRERPILYNTLNYAIVSSHQINTCTVLYFSVLYCIKKSKFAYKEVRTHVSKTEVHSTTELANFVAFNVSDKSSAKVSICTV